MRKFPLLLLCVVLAICVAKAQTSHRLIDANDQTPITSAAIFDATGCIVGLSMNDGTLPSIPDSAYPITIRSLGYELKTISSPEEGDWQLTPKSYPIEPVVVVPAKYEVMKQTFYVRIFINGGVSKNFTQKYMEFMAECFVPASKESKYRGSQELYPYPARRYVYTHRNEKDTLIYQTDSKLAWELMAFEETPKKGFEVPESFKNADGNTTVTHVEEGKSGVLGIIKQKGQHLTLSMDMLAKKKNHVWSPWLLKVLGIKFNIRQLYGALTYQANSEGIYLPKDLLDCSFLMEFDMAGKSIYKAMEIDEPMQINYLTEMYLTGSEYLTLDEAESAIQNRPEEIPLTIPDRVSPLDSATLQLIEKVKAGAATPAEE